MAQSTLAETPNRKVLTPNKIKPTPKNNLPIATNESFSEKLITKNPMVKKISSYQLQENALNQKGNMEAIPAPDNKAMTCLRLNNPEFP